MAVYVTGADGIRRLVAGNSDGDIAQSNPNLFDNAYFGKPINQRAQTEYIENGYTIDRWIQDSYNEGKLQIHNGFIRGIKTNSSFIYQAIAQRFDPEYSKSLGGKLVTFSAMVRGTGLHRILMCDLSIGENIIWETIPASPDWNIISTTCIIPNNIGKLACVLYYDANNETTNYTDFLAAKLELGGHQTLARKIGDQWVLNDPPPDPTLELLKCQRYQCVIPFGVGQPISNVIVDGNGSAYFPIYLPVQMRLDIAKIEIQGNLRTHIAGGGYRNCELDGTASLQGNICNLRAYGLETNTACGLDSDTGGKIIVDENL